MAADFMYDPRARRLLGLPPLSPASVGRGGSFGGAGASFPDRAAGPRRTYSNADIPEDPAASGALPPATLAEAAAPAPMPTPNPQPAPPPTPPALPGMPKYTNADLPPAPAAQPGGLAGLFSNEALNPDPLGMGKPPAGATPIPPATPPPSRLAQAAASAPMGGGALSMGDAPIRGVLPGAGTFGLVQPTDTRGEELGRSTSGTPAAGNANNRDGWRPQDPDAWINRRHGVPGIINAVGDVERGAGEANAAAARGAGDMISGAARSVKNFFTGRPQEAASQTASSGPTTVLPNGQSVVRASNRPNAPPAPAPATIEQAKRSAEQTSRPKSREEQGPPKSAAGVPSYTNADLDAVREKGPQRGGIVFGAEEMRPIGDRIDQAVGERALGDLKASNSPGLLPSQRRNLEYKKEEGEIRFAAMDRIIEEDAERQIAEVTSMPGLAPAQRKAVIDNIHSEALQQKLWNRRLGVAGWPRSGVDSYDPATGAPLYAPPQQ